MTHATAQDVRRSVHIRTLIQALSIEVHKHHHRAVCRLCAVGSKWTVSCDREGRLWFCHRCHEREGVLNLVQAVRNWGFRRRWNSSHNSVASSWATSTRSSSNDSYGGNGKPESNGGPSGRRRKQPSVGNVPRFAMN